MLMLIAFMITVSIGGIVIFLFSKDKFMDAVGLLALKVYLGATMLQWGLVLELIK
ncbi:hypothetical protein BCR44DRAFT_58932 [Catenaria anguillulae PL171]|uniref:Uncharacterized protein n=1 Tax=Catenaria anguillulae PL171 TaxID=765915 RepID=A0A1Y2HEP6_9FUNG|nr:hypothetical protein BCR44DRAFT_58932 [Catenaria anguillulae PL171]